MAVGTMTSGAGTWYNQMGWRVLKHHTPTLIATIDAGSGATFAALAGTFSVYQLTPHSMGATANVRGDARL